MKLHLLQLPRLIAQRRSSAIFGVLIILISWLGVALKYAEDVRNDLRDAKRTDENYALVFEENVLRSLREADSTLLNLRHAIESEKDKMDYDTILRTTDLLSDIILQVAVVDADGILRASNLGPQPTPAIDLSDRAHFRAQLNSDQDRLFISQPVIGRNSGKWSIQLTRRFLNSNGTFGGVIVGSLDPIYFTRFYDDVDLASSGLIALIGDDGVVRAAGGRSGDRLMGRNVSGTEMFARMKRGVNSSFEQTERDTGETRLVSLRRVKGQPLWVAVSVDKNEILAGSSFNRYTNGVAALLLTLITLGALERIFRTEAKAQQKSEQLQLTLESMSQGIMLVTKDLDIPIINKRCSELLKLPPEFVKNPPRFDVLSSYQESSAPNTTVKLCPPPETPAGQAPAPHQPPISEWTTPDGTVLEVRTGDLPDGGFVQTFTDITERAKAEANIARLASEDSLTGLLNRRGFRAALIEIQDGGSADPVGDALQYAVLFLDLDRFKVINDTLGHRIGDLLLQATAARLQTMLRSTDIMARLGGDEFAAIVRHIKSDADLENLVQCLIAAIAKPFDLGGYGVRTSISIGIAVAPKDGAQADDLVIAADLALYAAKEHNRGGYEFYEPAMAKDVAERRQIELDLREAIERNELELYFQPIVRLHDDSIAGFEALARWNHRAKGFVPPSAFIPVAEDAGLIVRLGEWALSEACRRVAELPGELSVAVNLSPVQFSVPNLLETVQRALTCSGLAPHRLELEITERLLLDNNQNILNTLHGLKRLGVRIALDDFGTGYSALSYLRKFPLDRIKIDRSFTSGLAASSDQLAIVQAVISVARALGMAVTAEGIETADQHDFLKALGCDNGQGYLIGVPVSFEKLADIVARPNAVKGIAA